MVRGLNHEIVKIAGPSFVALALDPLLTVVDTAFVGRVGDTDGLAAMGVTAAVLGVAYPSTSFLTNAGTPLVAATKDRGRAVKLSKGIAGVGLVVGLGLCLVLEATGSELTRIRGLGAPAVVLTNALTGTLRGLGDATAPLTAALLASFVNVGLDAAFVPSLGASGAAMATTAAEFVAALYLAFVFAGQVYSQPHSSESSEFDSLSSSFFVVSAGLTLARTLALQLFLAAVTAKVATAGTDALAANHILRSAYSFLSFATDALAVAAQTLVAGAPTIDEKQQIAVRLFVWGAALGAFFSLGLFFLSDPIVANLLDANSAHVAALAATEMRTVLAPLQLLSSLVFVADGVLQGATAFRYEAAAMLTSVAIAGAVLGFFGPDAADSASTLDTAWLAVCVLQAARFSTFIVWWLFLFRRKDDDSSNVVSATPSSPTTSREVLQEDHESNDLRRRRRR